MIYVETEPCHTEGSHEFFRVYADGHDELMRLLRSMKLSPVLQEPGQPNEHVIMSATSVNRLKGSLPIDDRGKVKLFAHKAKRGPEPDVHTALAPESIDAALSQGEPPAHASDCAVHNEPAMPAGECDCGAEGQPSEKPRTSRLIIKTRGKPGDTSTEPSEGASDGNDAE